MNNINKKEISYYRLKLENYIKDYQPQMINDTNFITARADEALTVYCDAISQGFSHPQAETMASETLFAGLHFSKYDMIISVLENEFERDLPSPLPERLAPILLNNEYIKNVFAKYNITDNFDATDEYEKLYTELTGAIEIAIEVNQLPTINK
jgi:Domain of unknown function (DUF1896).